MKKYKRDKKIYILNIIENLKYEYTQDDLNVFKKI